jgi:signal transduction histidine kinase
VEADRSRLRQVLHNLIKNALEAHNEGGGPARVSVATRAVEVDGESDAAVELSVRDAGPGIRADMVDRLFEPYMTGKPRGSGLGLAIVRKIVEEHGGQVAAENAEGGGAIIRVRLPRSSTPVERGSAA